MPQLGLSPVEEAFFRAGDALFEVDSFADLDDGMPQRTVWQAIWSWLRNDRSAAAIGRAANLQF